jgi:hypothetical protein
MRFSTATPVSLSFSLFACFLYACHLMQRCLNCQSNFRLKVFLLFLIPTAVSFFVYSFFCFSHASVLPDFLNWLLLCLLYTCHLMQRCVPAVVFQQSCSNSRVSASTFQHVSLLCCSICVRFQQSCFSNYVSAFVIQHLCFSTYVSLLCCSNYFLICVAASVFAFNSRVSATTFSAFVIQHLCFSTYVSLLCCSNCFRICVAASVFDHLRHSTVIAINDNLNHLR